MNPVLYIILLLNWWIIKKFVNKKHPIKKYIDRACLLLRGADSTHQPLPTQQDDDNNNDEPKKEEPKTEEPTKGDNDEKEQEEEKETEKIENKMPSKIYDQVHIIGVGRTMGKVVHTAELVKRIIGGLHQVTKLESIEVKDSMFLCFLVCI